MRHSRAFSDHTALATEVAFVYVTTVDINKRDLIQLRKDIERVRMHEEKRRVAEAGAQQPSETGSESGAGWRCWSETAARLRVVFQGLFGETTPSGESLKAIPEYVVTLLQAIREQPNFEKWIFEIEAMPANYRNQLLEKMSFAFRVEDAKSIVAIAFDRLKDQSLFKAFCQTLRDEK